MADLCRDKDKLLCTVEALEDQLAEALDRVEKQEEEVGELTQELEEAHRTLDDLRQEVEQQVGWWAVLAQGHAVTLPPPTPCCVGYFQSLLHKHFHS